MDNNKKFIGVFNNQTEVIRKIEELKAEGYAETDIYAVAKDADNISMVRGRTGAEVESTTAGGSWMDKFMAFLSGEDEVRGGLRNMGLDDADSDRYYNDIEAGKILLYVDKDYDQYYRDRTLTNETNPNLGTTAFGMGQNVNTVDGYVDGVRADRVPHLDVDADLTDEQRLRLREERLEVDKERVQTGEVHVEKDVVEEERTVNVNVERDEVYVERRAVDEVASGLDTSPIIEDDDSIRIPITEERVEVTKRPVVTEELIVGKRKVQDTETVRDTVKREEAHVEGTGDLEVENRDSTDSFLNHRRDDELTDNIDRHDRF
ncbi:YsnF/AvaK domain-containing protein [Bacillus aerolatus]|uniref:YsnF/AvaK domain-containing protein n=1 Tax=Bacillus aerolatus TaxID=2653354 RepID=A0A6I1FN25_9BACI|nr:YsnF/AvaK domain-containing protein [Bacillus aerolatus]KAB7705363.1 YsnF/AvaK domain-containing protein [Bacillus aerolatus]